MARRELHKSILRIALPKPRNYVGNLEEINLDGTECFVLSWHLIAPHPSADSSLPCSIFSASTNDRHHHRRHRRHKMRPKRPFRGHGSEASLSLRHRQVGNPVVRARARARPRARHISVSRGNHKNADSSRSTDELGRLLSLDRCVGSDQLF